MKIIKKTSLVISVATLVALSAPGFVNAQTDTELQAPAVSSTAYVKAVTPIVPASPVVYVIPIGQDALCQQPTLVSYTNVVQQQGGINLQQPADCFSLQRGSVTIQAQLTVVGLPESQPIAMVRHEVSVASVHIAPKAPGRPEAVVPAVTTLRPPSYFSRITDITALPSTGVSLFIYPATDQFKILRC